MVSSLPIESFAAAPWSLSGRGFVLAYRIPPALFHGLQNIPAPFAGGLSFLMLADYSTSGAGAYQELAFLPGRFLTPAGRRYSIQPIYVSTLASQLAGQANWWIPKDTARFQWDRKGSREEITVFFENKPIFNTVLRSLPLPFPVHTALFPLPLAHWYAWHTGHALHARQSSQACLTRLNGYGMGRLVKVEHISSSAETLPEFQKLKPLAAFCIDPFRCHFPVGQIIASSPS